MRDLGWVALVVGVIWGFIALNMNTSFRGVHNLSLANRRETHLMIGAVLFIAGVIAVGFGSIRTSTVAKTPVRMAGTARPTSQSPDVSSYIDTLVERGYRVRETSAGRWEVKAPRGGAFYFSSSQEFRRFIGEDDSAPREGG